SDFKVLEDGKEQKVANFEEVTVRRSGMPLRQPANVVSNMVLDPQQAGNVTVILLDQINKSFFDQSYARWSMIKYLWGNLQPGQPLALFAMGSKGVRVLCGLSTAPETLVAGLKNAGSEQPLMQHISANAGAVAALQGHTEFNQPVRTAADAAALMRQFVV